MPDAQPKYHDPVRITTGTIISGVYYRAFETLPFERESDLPPNLRALVSTDPEAEAEAFHPSERDFYRPELRRQARQVRSNVQWQAWAEEQAEQAQALPPDVEEVLQAEHDKRIAKLKAEMAYNQGATDAAYAQAARRLQRGNAVFCSQRRRNGPR
jgi:hypothetical protein